MNGNRQPHVGDAGALFQEFRQKAVGVVLTTVSPGRELVRLMTDINRPFPVKLVAIAPTQTWPDLAVSGVSFQRWNMKGALLPALRISLTSMGEAMNAIAPSLRVLPTSMGEADLPLSGGATSLLVDHPIAAIFYASDSASHR